MFFTMICIASDTI